MTIWRMRNACWINKAIQTHSEYVILIAFPPQQWLYERASMLLNVHCLFCVYFPPCNPIHCRCINNIICCPVSGTVHTQQQAFLSSLPFAAVIHDPKTNSFSCLAVCGSASVLLCQARRNILLAITRRKANWLDHMLRKDCLIKYVIKRKDKTRKKA